MTGPITPPPQCPACGETGDDSGPFLDYDCMTCGADWRNNALGMLSQKDERIAELEAEIELCSGSCRAAAKLCESTPERGEGESDG